YNKGAQAMTFTVINEIRTRFPDKEIVLLSTKDFNSSVEEKEKYNFEIMVYNPRIKMALAGGIYWLCNRLLKYGVYRKKYGNYEKRVEEFFRNADMLIDISGYGFSSQWGFLKSYLYLMNIMIAQKYKVPVYILPQSLGPFNYRNVIAKTVLEWQMKKYLKYPEVIYAREIEGYDAISEYTQQNVKISLDIVLQNNQAIDLTHIYKAGNLTEQKVVPVEGNSVGIVPNEKIMVHGNSEQIYDIYAEMVESLLKHNKKVYLLRHSTEDLTICRKIKSRFLEEKDVVLLEDDYNCIELQNILSQFNFIIASRYHSVIHAYKEAVPAIVLGWATKYKELLGTFSQGNYLFDVRESLNKNEILKSLEKMLGEYSDESGKISMILKEKRNDCIFKQILDRKGCA
ncbi:MAG TPA: polysaccharide pyruvyl transferase family protein, partial [Candidatus Nitrosocosmicus sp.]|nr:polysaccharide pyruvyl transferase family protein [Candidatus Nitrosocosmicus sp.]